MDGGDTITPIVIRGSTKTGCRSPQSAARAPERTGKSPQAVSFKYFSESPQDANVRHRGCAPSGVRFATDVANHPRPPVELPRTML
jgi:hypothetical protein